MKLRGEKFRVKKIGGKIEAKKLMRKKFGEWEKYGEKMLRGKIRGYNLGSPHKQMVVVRNGREVFDLGSWHVCDKFDVK